MGVGFAPPPLEVLLDVWGAMKVGENDVLIDYQSLQNKLIVAWTKEFVCKSFEVPINIHNFAFCKI